MSSGKTSALGLNQWQLSDPFLMEELNVDNRKLEAALGAVPVVKLMDVTTTAEADQVELDLSGIDLSPYVKLEIIALPLITSTDAGARAQVFVKLNGAACSCMRRQDSAASTTNWYNYAASFYATNNDAYAGMFEMAICGRFAQFGSKKSLFELSSYSSNLSNSASCQVEWAHCLTYLDALTSISFVPTDTASKFEAGSKFLLTGVRA